MRVRIRRNSFDFLGLSRGRAFTFCHQKESASVSLVDHERVALALYAAARVSRLVSRRLGSA